MSRIETHLSQNDYIKVRFYLIYRKALTKVMVFAAVISLLVSIVSITKDLSPNFPTSELLFATIVLFVIPLLIYLGTKRNYKLNKELSEKITYYFSPDMVRVEGETFNSEMTWDRIFMVTESRSWLLLWQNRQIVNIIPKRYLSVGQLSELRSMMLNILGLKRKLKK